VKIYPGAPHGRDEATSVVWGMPGFVSRAGLAHRTLPLDAIAHEIMRACAPASASRSQGSLHVAQMHVHAPAGRKL
jgi:two-component system chemotaxis response regulator CheB